MGIKINVGKHRETDDIGFGINGFYRSIRWIKHKNKKGGGMDHFFPDEEERGSMNLNDK